MTALHDFLDSAPAGGLTPSADAELRDPMTRVPGAETPWPAWLPEHVSASSLKLARGCLEAYRQRYVLGHREPPGAGLAWGIGDHAAVAWAFRERVTTGAYPAPSQVQERFAHELDTTIADNGGAGEYDWKDGETVSTVKDAGAVLVGLYAQQALPILEPMTIEQRHEAHPEWLPVPLVGYIDATVTIREPLADPRLAILERKTTGRDQMAPDWLFQGQTMQLFVALPVEFHLSIKTKTPKLNLAPQEPSPVNRARGWLAVGQTVQQIAFCAATYGPDEPWPDAVRGWNPMGSPCGMCGHRPVCPWWT